MTEITFRFHNHEGREIIATLIGAPGHRRVEFAYDTPARPSLGSVPLPVLLRDPSSEGGWCCMLAPVGDVEGCHESELVLLDLGVVEALAEWAQDAALGPRRPEVLA